MNFSKVDEFLDSITGTLVPSNDCSVYLDHEEIYRRTFGFSDEAAGVRITGSELYNMYSATKVVTATAGMILLERGLIHLDDPVSAYLPEYASLTVRDGDAVRPAKNIMTVRHLFTMTAGMNYNMRAPGLLSMIERTNGECPTREVARALAEDPLDFEPGTHWQYGLCHDVLAAVCEVAAGRRFSEFVRENVFIPCSMYESSFHPDEAAKARIAPMYNYSDKRHRYERIGNGNSFVLGPGHDAGGAAVVSSVRDMALFCDALACGGEAASGERILTEESVRLMSTDMLDDSYRSDFSWPQYVGYGYGLGVRTLITHDLGAKSSIGEFGWAGAAGAYVMCDPETRLSVFCTRHMHNNKEAEITPTLRNLICEAVFER